VLERRSRAQRASDDTDVRRAGQIRGERITEATDVYALGCVLYELLTGQHARDVSKAANIREVQQIVETTDPVAPSRLKLASMPVARKRLRGDLDTIVLTALRREPARRYVSAAAFAADLKSYLDGKPILARGDGIFYRSWKISRRHRAGTTAGLMVAAIAVAAIMYEGRDRTVAQPAAPVPPGTSVAIVDFNNLSQGAHDAWLATALAEMLSTELAAGSKVHVLPDELVRSARVDLAAPLAGGYAMKSLATLRKRLGADYILSGSYLVGSGSEPTLHLDLVPIQEVLELLLQIAEVLHAAREGVLDHVLDPVGHIFNDIHRIHGLH
jgi:TolB-like protein